MAMIGDRLDFVGLDAGARAVLRRAAPLLNGALPAVLDQFYREIAATPRLKRLFASEADMAHAKAAQLRHWDIILGGEFDDTYMDSAIRIGKAHNRIGLQPHDYIASYAKLLTGMHNVVDTGLRGWRNRQERRRLRDALTRAALLDMDLALTVYIEQSSDDQSHKTLREMCEIIEADLDSAVAGVLSVSDEAALRGEGAAQDAKAIAADAREVAASSQQATTNVTTVSAATEQLSAAGREIAQRAVQMAEYATRAAGEVEQASATVAALDDAATRIGTVTTLIAEVAAQTNLLALNATIEAARAGEAGKGFAVVAHEVKALSRKTREAADDISRRIEDICKASHESIEAMSKVGTAVTGIREVTGAVAAAAEQQETTLLDVARSLTEASQGVAVVSKNVERISGRSSEIESQSRLVSELVNGTNGRVAELRANLVVSLRSSSAGDRRSQENRRPISVHGRMRSERGLIEGTVLDLSEGGLRFRAREGAATVEDGCAITVATREFGDVPGKVIAVGKSSIHVQFDEMSDERKGAIATFLGSVDEADRRFVAAIRETAARVGSAFEAAVANGEITERQLFDFSYRPIAGTTPQQFETPFNALCDRVLPALQEPMLSLDPRVVFCAAVDSNAFLPTHNRKFSLAPRPDDPTWNAANCRNRRFFKDGAGLRAARTTREYLLQTYDRDMGGGQMVTLKEVDAPIRVNGKHWGGLRLAFTA